jgi:hypothetical protein
MMIIEDDRTEEQKKTNPVLIIGTDSFLSGWGGAKDGVSIAVWACRPEHREKVLGWVQSRSDMVRVRESLDDGAKLRYRPKGKGHCHIYIVDENHRAI